MAIKADRWIKHMAETTGMIEPFAANQVREGVISYGVSSFGYDIRVADEFKIFTSATGELTVIDPKRFDSKSFVDFRGPECIIPPNSFALARTVEYFRIPNNVLTICVGKSTYARCFRGNTRVALVDGTAPTLEDMARRGEEGEMFWGYSIGQHGRMLVTLLEAPRHIGQDALIEVILDSGASVECTGDHLFMLRDGRMLPAHDLRPGISLMPLYRQVARGYEMAYQPLNGHLYPTHRLADEWNIRHGIYDDTPGTHRHHIDHDRRNNRPWNIMRMDAHEHIQLSAVQQERPLNFWSDDAYDGSRFPDLLQSFRGTKPPRNHKVVSVREIAGTHDVYCLTVPEAGNFALEAGVFVHNCGIIVNVTPFEPGWQGFVTLEISNTTPLPARIYANEGIAQVLFFEGDETPTVTYDQRQGKYQGQSGVTLPKL